MFRFLSSLVGLVFATALVHGADQQQRVSSETPEQKLNRVNDLTARLAQGPLEGRQEAAFELCQFGPDDLAPAAPILIEVLRKDPDARVRQLAAFALGNLGNHGKAAVAPLVDALKDRDEGVRALAAQALGSTLVPLAEQAIPALIRQLNDREESPCWHAARALGNFQGKAKAAVPRLIELLGDTRASVRREAATALGEIGPAAREGVPALKKALADNNPLVRERAARSLQQLDPNTAAPSKTP